MDEHVPGPITNGLRRAGIDVLTVQEDGLAAGDDPIVLDRATQLGRILFPQDEDFLRHASDYQRPGQSFSGVIYGH
jgi:predicted nuclease of predicted toxin-antitoxin system